MSNDLSAFKLYHYPLLTPEEEIELGRRIQTMMPLLDKDPESLTREEKLAVRRGQKARQRMVEGNLRLVLSCCKKFYSTTSHMTLGDLVQEGNIGLCRAAEKFDPSRGYKFSTYAYWWIRQGITRAIRDKEHTIRVPCNMYDYVSKATRWRDKYVKDTGRQPTLEQMAAAVGVANVNMLRKAFAAAIPMRSLDSTTNNQGEDVRLIDIIADTAADADVQEAVFSEYDKELMLKKLEEIDPEQRQTLKIYYGFEGDALTYQEIANNTGVSREAVRTRVTRAQKALRLKIAGKIK